MSYNAQNRLVSYTDSTGPNKTFGYDNRGNISAWGNLSLVYDSADQPRSISGTPDYVCPPKPAVCIPPAPVNATYKYDGNLKRVKSVVGGKTMYNVYDASGTLVHVDNITDAEATDYVKGAGMSLARIKNGTSVTHLHNDHLGSTASATDTGGAVQWTERYTPFGEVLSGTAANDNLAAYTGHIRDTATGLTYMQARYYDPVVGRFLSIDPVTFMDTGNPSYFNRYRYCSNDPINCTDPTGMSDGWALAGEQIAFQIQARSYAKKLNNTTNLNARVALANRYANTFENYGVPRRATLQDEISSRTVTSRSAKGINYSQTSIGKNFSNGSSVAGLIDDLKSGKVKAGDLPPIRVFQDADGNTTSLDNRRLYAAQQAGVDVNTVPAAPSEVQSETRRKNVSQSSVKVRKGSTREQPRTGTRIRRRR